MLYQVLQLTPEQINALPPAERDAIQQLVGSRSRVIHVACFVWKTDSCILGSVLYRGVSSWVGESPLDASATRPHAPVARFGVCLSHG